MSSKSAQLLVPRLQKRMAVKTTTRRAQSEDLHRSFAEVLQSPRIDDIPIIKKQSSSFKKNPEPSGSRQVCGDTSLQQMQRHFKMTAARNISQKTRRRLAKTDSDLAREYSLDAPLKACAYVPALPENQQAEAIDNETCPSLQVLTPVIDQLELKPEIPIDAGENPPKSLLNDPSKSVLELQSIKVQSSK